MPLSWIVGNAFRVFYQARKLVNERERVIQLKYEYLVLEGAGRNGIYTNLLNGHTCRGRGLREDAHHAWILRPEAGKHESESRWLDAAD